MKRIFIVLLLCCLLSLVSGTSAGTNTRVDIVIPPDNPGYSDFAKAIRHNLLLLDHQLSIDIVIATEADNAPTAPQGLAITVSDSTLPWALAHADRYQNVLAFYVSSTVYRSLAVPDNFSAVFRDQPLARQLALSRVLLPGATSAVVLVDDGSLPKGLRKLKKHTDVQFSVLDISQQPNWPGALSQLMVTNDVLLAQDNAAIYNPRSVRSLLLTTYRHGKVIVGPNQAFVRAGSLASAYTSSDQYLRQLSHAVADLLQQGSLPEPRFPTEFRVAINRQVAGSLGIALPSEDSAAWQLRQLEAKR